jgi:hypothetical protein
MKYVENWDERQKHFIAWWKGLKLEKPLMKVVARRKEPVEELEIINKTSTPEEVHLDVNRIVKEMRNFCRTHKFMADSFPNINVNIGPGSMVTYLGSDPVFAYDTVWYKESVEDWNEAIIAYDEKSHWLQRHLRLIRQAQESANGDFNVNIPDIVENIDILSALRGPQNMCYDIVDEPDQIKELIQKIDKLYFMYYDQFYNIVKSQDGSCSYTSFDIWGHGKTAKIQCDFSAMMSPAHFRDLVLPSLQKQCEQLNCSLYHLDGPGAVRHVDALMEIKDLRALQWSPGAGQPDGGSEKWYPIYEKVRSANKSLWISISDGRIEDWIASAKKLIKIFGTDGLYLLFPVMEEQEAARLIGEIEQC